MRSASPAGAKISVYAAAEPLKFLPQSLRFAESLFYEAQFLVESVDIIPENAGRSKTRP